MEEPDTTQSEKHFLDTSVARPMLVGTSRYKAYFAEEFGEEPCYISKYVQMEFKRSYLRNMIAFYFILHLDTIPTIGDAMIFWSNRFKPSELKATHQMIGNLLNSYRFNWENPRDKQKALNVLGLYIKRLEMKLRRKFKDIGINTARCACAEVVFKVGVENMADGFRKFVEDFDDVQRCRSRCRVDDFLINRHGEPIHSYVKKATPLPNNKANRGFKNIAKNLDDILQKGATACTCKICSLCSPTTSSYGEKVGDAIIALETPRDMRLEHTDNSFNHLCPPLGLNHKQHPSESKVVQSSTGR